MSNPNAGLHDEIDNQGLGDFYGGSDAATMASYTLSTFDCVVSYLLGDPGWVCTLSVECQKSCSPALQ